MRSFLLAFLLVVVFATASAFRNPGAASVVGSPDEKIETNRRKVTDSKVKEVSVKAKTSAAKALQSKKEDKVEGEVNVVSDLCLN